MLVLVVEDDPLILRMLRRGLERDGYEIEIAPTGRAALKALSDNSPHDLVILDIQIPPPDGIEVCRRLRERGDERPILMLTGRSLIAERVRGLDAGADDYLVKPFQLPELLARLRALLRRAPEDPSSALQVDDLVLDPRDHTVARGDTPLQLTAREFAVLRVLMENVDVVVARAVFIERVWGLAFAGNERVVDVYIRYLREKIDEPFGLHSIRTVRGVGYQMLRQHRP